MSGLALDPATHTYTVRGTRLPGVSAILKAAGLIQPMEWATEWHLTRGREVHAATALYDQGVADEYDFDPIVVPRLEAYKAWRASLGARLTFTEIETSHAHPTLGYCGTPDRVALLDGVRTIIELKNGVEQPAHRWQAAGYAMLTGATGRVGVYVNGDGKMGKMVTWTDRQDAGIFGSALALYTVRAKHNLLPA